MKLNIGSSSCHLDGWINLEYDVQYWRKNTFSGERISPKATRDMPDVFGDAKNLSNLYKDNTFDEVRASHVLEHLPIGVAIATLKEWNRILKVGGLLRVIVPDIEFIINKWVRRESEEKWWNVQKNDLGLYLDSELKSPFNNEDEALVHLIFLNGHHKNAFTNKTLSRYMSISGFDDIRRCDNEEENIPDCTVCDYSLRLIGRKI